MKVEIRGDVVQFDPKHCCSSPPHSPLFPSNYNASDPDHTVYSRWEGEGVNEVGKESETGIVRVVINPKYYRPTEVEQLLGDASKAKQKLGWVATVTVEVWDF